jgi:hypothetical protein
MVLGKTYGKCPTEDPGLIIIRAQLDMRQALPGISSHEIRSDCQGQVRE